MFDRLRLFAWGPLKEILSPSLRLVITSLANKLINLDSQTLLKILTVFKDAEVAAPSVEELQNLEKASTEEELQNLEEDSTEQLQKALTKKLEQLYPEKVYEDFIDEFIKEQQSLNASFLIQNSTVLPFVPSIKRLFSRLLGTSKILASLR